MDDEQIRNAVTQTEILRFPKQNLFTFGTTNIYYYLLTEASYSDLVGVPPETVIREGRVIAEKPKLVTPYYLTQLEGFSPEARKYFNDLVEHYGANTPGLYYSYRNEPKEMNIVSQNMREVAEKINGEIDERNDPLAAIIKGEDVLWDVSLMKFIFEITRTSAPHNISQMKDQGFLEIDSRGIPVETKRKIEFLFGEVDRGERDAEELKAELERWGLFKEYEDEFLDLFRKYRKH